MRYSILLHCAILIAGLAAMATGQTTVTRSISDFSTPPSVEPGTPASAYPLSGFETVNLYNGKLVVTMPLLEVGARGGAGYTMYMKIDTGWTVEKEEDCSVGMDGDVYCNPPRYWFFGGYSSLGDGEFEAGRVFAKHAGIYGSCYGGGTSYSYGMIHAKTVVVFTDSRGTEIELRDTQYNGDLRDTGNGFCVGSPANRQKTFTARDGSAITFIADTDIVDWELPGEEPLNGRLLFPDGTMYRIRESRVDYIRDKDGNLTKFAYDTAIPKRLVQVVDSLNRQVNISYTSTQKTITFPKYGSGTNSIVIRSELLSTSSPVPRIRDYYVSSAHRVQPLNVLFPTSTSTYVNDFYVVADVTWPNSRKHEFFYNNYSEIARIKLPTGGSFEYDWDKAVTHNNGIATQAGGMVGDGGFVYRRVKERRTYTADSVLEGVIKYENNDFDGGASLPTNLEVTVRKRATSSGSDIAVNKHAFHSTPQRAFFGLPVGGFPGWREGKEFQVQATDPANPYSLSGGWLRTDVTDWWQGSPFSGPPADNVASANPYIRRVTTKIPNPAGGEKHSKVEYQYDSYNNETIRQEFGYGNGTPGTPERLTETQYFGGTYPTDANVHLRRLPTNVKVYGYPGSTQTLQSETTVAYDETGTYPIQGCASIPGHDTVYSTFLSGNPSASTYRTHTPTERGTTYAPRGLATTVRQRVDGGSTWITTNAQYDLAGNLVKSWDGRSHPTTLSYQTANCSFLTSVTTKSVTSTGTDHTVLMQYDSNTGKMNQHTDPSGVVTALSYESNLGRLSQVTNGSGSTTPKTSWISYDDSAQTATLTAELTDSLTSSTITKYDGLGRLRETEQATGGSSIISRIEYDALGRALRRSLPSDNGAYQYTTFTYDALDRVFKAANADSSISRTCYKGDQVIARDEAGKWRLSQMDALGRLISVTEDPSAVSCDGQSSANPGLAYVTNYSYNAIDNLLSVSHMVGSSAGQTRSFSYDMAGRLLTANNPETGTITYSLYDGNGNLGRKTDARGWQTNYFYDNLNRPTSKTYSDANTSSVTWIWDTAKVGRLTSVDSGISKTTFTYDTVARIATSVQRTDSVDYDFVYRYHKGWGLKQVQYPSDRWIRYTPDVAGRLVTVERLTSAEALDKTYWSGVQYAPQGAPKQISLGNTLTERWDLNTTRQQPWEIKIGTASNDSDRGKWQFNYCGGYNNGSCATNNGNILGQWNYTPNRIQTYSYDALNRLATVSEGGTGSWSETYGYDRYSNLYWANRTGLGTAHIMKPISTAWFTNNHNRAVPTSGSESSYYDNAGNMIQYGSLSIAYDAENRPRQVTGSGTVSYSYDGEGRRVKKVDGSVITRYVYDASGNLAAEYGGTTPTADATHFITTDHLGSTRLVTDGSGNVVSRHDYLPFGEEIGAGIGGRTTAQMYVANNTLTQRFTGKERDAETGLDYFGARYFSGAQGRFTSPDALMASANVANPQSWNRYVYTNNNPLRYTDPSGLYASPAFNCSEGSNACLNDDQRRILNASTVKIGGKEYSGEALYNKMDEKQQNAFVNVTDKLGSIKLDGGGTALSQVQSITGDPRKGKEGTIANDRIFANVSGSLEGAIKGAGNFASAPGHGPFSSSYKSTDGPLGNIQFSFQGTHADIDIDIGNMKAKGMGAIVGGIVHTGEVIQNGLFGTTTNQDVVRKILLANPKVGITPSTDARFNRK